MGLRELWEGSRSGGPADLLAGSQAGLNGPSGSPTSLPERVPLDGGGAK